MVLGQTEPTEEKKTKPNQLRRIVRYSLTISFIRFNVVFILILNIIITILRLIISFLTFCGNVYCFYFIHGFACIELILTEELFAY